MGLFSKKEACPVCGGEVKGLFLTKIGDKQILCKNCSEPISMDKELLKTATPEFIREHLDYRRKNAEKYAALQWTTKFTSIPGLQVGIDEVGKAIYLIHDDLHDDKENPVVLSFNQLTGYELLRRKKTVDDLETAGRTVLETGLTAIAEAARLVNNESSENYDYFQLKLTANDPYWSEINLRIDFRLDRLYGFNGFSDELVELCRMLKSIINRELGHNTYHSTYGQ